MIIIFDTYGGLCNQMYDIQCGINFCIVNNIKFSFRNCSFRNNDLISWCNKKFEKLFDLTLLAEYENLYIKYSKNFNLNSDNTYNYDSERAILIFTKNYLNEIKNINKEYIIIKQFWAINKFEHIVCNIFPFINPSNKLIEVYEKIKNKIMAPSEKYNFIHYRYEKDFTSHFNVKVEKLKHIILEFKNKFKNPQLKIYIATTNINELIDTNDNEICDLIITKNENKLSNYNFEEKAFIDYMFGLNSNEVFGHSKSSFSHMLNNSKNTSNYYDK